VSAWCSCQRSPTADPSACCHPNLCGCADREHHNVIVDATRQDTLLSPRTSKDICVAPRNSQQGHKHRHSCCAREFAYSHNFEVGVHVEDPRRQGRQLVIVQDTPARLLQTVTLSLMCTRPLQHHCRQSRYHYCARDPCKIIVDSHVIINVHETPAR